MMMARVNQKVGRKKFRCGFYGNVLNWTLTARTQQEAAEKFAKMIKRKKLSATNGETKFVVFEVQEG